MLTDWAGLTRSPSLPMGGTIQARRRHTHTHTPPDLEQPPLTDRSATVLSRKPCLPWDTWLPTENTHIHTERPECACIHTHTLENFLPAYTTHKSQAQTCTHRDKCTPENMYFTTKTLNNALTSSTGRKTRAHMTVDLNTTLWTGNIFYLFLRTSQHRWKCKMVKTMREKGGQENSRGRVHCTGASNDLSGPSGREMVSGSKKKLLSSTGFLYMSWLTVLILHSRFSLFFLFINTPLTGSLFFGLGFSVIQPCCLSVSFVPME